MKSITFLLLLSLLNCFTVYKKDETVLEKEKLETKDVKEERDVYVLTHSLNPKGLYLFLDAYRVEEKSKVDFIREKYEENKDFKYEEKYTPKDCRKSDCLGLAVISIPIFLVELTTIPFRLMSFPKERIKEEIRKGNVSKIKSISTSNVNFALLDKNSNKKYNFQSDRIFIPTSELKLDSFNSKKFPYQLTDSKTKNIILAGNFDFSESISKYKEFEAVIEENNLKNKLAECKLIYPNLAAKETTYEQTKKELDNLCPKYGMQVTDPTENQNRYTYCYNNFEGCYYLTRDTKKPKK
jgi:hypothetical protein